MAKQFLDTDVMIQRAQTSQAATRIDSPETDAATDFCVATIVLAGLLAVVFLPTVVLGAAVGASAYALTPRLRDQGIEVVSSTPTQRARSNSRHAA